jgi:hypothetical protein
MADEPAKKGFSLRNPGGKEYLIVGGVVLAAALLYYWYKNKTGTAAAPASSAAGGPSTPTGLSTSSFVTWITDHGSSPKGLYLHADPKGGGQPYFTEGGKRVFEGSGPVTINGKQYYYHGAPKGGGAAYFTLGGKKVTPPSGAVTT